MTQPPERLGAFGRGLLLSTSALTVMTGATLSADLPSLRRAFAGDTRVEWLIPMLLTLPALGIALASPAFGFAADRWGRKPSLYVALVLYGICGLSGLVISDLGQLALARFVQGMGAGGIMTCATALVADFFRDSSRNRFLGIQSMLTGFGGATFLFVGGLLAELGWRAPFAVFGAAFLVLFGFVGWVPEPARVAKSLSKERLSGEARRHVIWVYAIGMTVMLGFYTIPIRLPFLLETGFGASRSLVGAILALSTIATALTAGRYSKLSSRLSYPKIAALSMVCFGLGLWLVGISGSLWTILVAVIVMGVGYGPVLPNGPAWLSAVIPAEMRGRVLGGLTSLLFLGQFVSPIALSPVSSSTGIAGPWGVFGVAGLAMVVAAAFVWALAPNLRRVGASS